MSHNSGIAKPDLPTMNMASLLSGSMEEGRSNIWVLMFQFPKEDDIPKHKIIPFYNIGSYRSQIPRSIVELDYHAFTGFCLGCLALQDFRTGGNILIDLTSMQKWDLPLIKMYDQVLLTSRPTEPDCRVLFHDGINRTLMFCRPGDTQVQRNDFTDILLDKNATLDSPVLYQGQIYTISFPALRLFRVEFGDSASSSPLQLVEVADASPQYFGTDCFYCLVESGGDLLLVEIIYSFSYPGFEVYDFKVYKLDVGGRRWKEVNDIGDYAILYSRYHSASVYAPDHYQIKKNSIYYFVKKDITLHSFDIKLGYTSKRSYLPHPDAAVDSNFADFQWLTLPAMINLLSSPCPANDYAQSPAPPAAVLSPPTPTPVVVPPSQPLPRRINGRRVPGRRRHRADSLNVRGRMKEDI